MDNSKLPSRRSMRKRKQPFYKKRSFLISLIVVIFIIVVGGLTYYFNHDNKTNDTQVENVQKNKSKPKKNTKKSAKQADANVTDDTQSDNSTSSEIKNAGTYNALTYKSDWFTFKISNDVKLVKDASGSPALLIKYNYTNKTNSKQTPQVVQANYMVIKQDGVELQPTTAASDYADIVNGSNNGLVLPNQSFDGALLVKVNDTETQVNMYFKNIKTNELLDTNQPFNLK
ncbi:DUF5067 domain-containing protein [Lactobacillus terrae]|uniref:DUF5067 domain-containing protein n=1 Tax=Lactobacillus terrae TaxID=2269374 RepID=UPI000C1B747F|nr:DUF5067 domain-containing protein [Lactobacillus terrae]